MASCTIKPETPVVVSLSDSTICLYANILDKIPSLSPKIRSLVPAADESGTFRANVDLRQFTLKNLACLLSKACNGVMDPKDYLFLKEQSMTSEKDYEMFMSAFNAPRCPQAYIIEKTDSKAAMMGLAHVGAMESAAISFEGKGTRQGMDFAPVAPDSKYNTSTLTIFPKDGREFLISRNGDLAHTLTLKVRFEPRTVVWAEDVLDTLFDSFEYSIGGSTFDSIDLTTNNALAKAYGLWPTRSNTPPKNFKETWVATIPIMITETTHHKAVQMPLIGLAYHEVRVKLIKVKQDLERAIRFAIDVDYVFLDSELRRYIANGGKTAPAVSGILAHDSTGPVPSTASADSWDSKPQWTDEQKKTEEYMRSINGTHTTTYNSTYGSSTTTCTTKDRVEAVTAAAAAASVRSCSCPRGHACEMCGIGTVPIIQHYHEQFEIPVDTSIFNLVLNKPTTGVSGGYMVVLRPKIQVPSNFINTITPVISASILINGNPISIGDTSDVTEFNWIKTGMEPPTNNTTLLLPFSREMFSTGVISSCRVDLSRIERIQLRLEMNKAVSFMKWSGTITAISNNFRKTKSQMSGLMFSA